LKVSNADKAHNGANLLARRFGPFVHLSLRGTYVGCNKVSAGARGYTCNLTKREDCRMCASPHKKHTDCEISSVGQHSVQVRIRFGFNDRVTVARFRFEAAAIENSNHSSTVTNQLAGLQRAGSLAYAFAPHAQHG
jgi:hypothetical protein